MTDKVRTAVFNKDLRVELKKYPLTKSGNKIDISSGGDGYFRPEIGPNQFLYWPIRKRYLVAGPWIYEPVYFSLRRGAKCINFGLDDPKAYGPDTEEIKNANKNLLATRIGSEAEQGLTWDRMVILVMVAIIFFRILGVF